MIKNTLQDKIVKPFCFKGIDNICLCLIFFYLLCADVEVKSPTT